MAEVVLGLAAAGVDVLRLDAVPFMWKRHGTNCQNQPEVHDLLQALRAVMRIAAPGGRVQGRGDRRRRATSSRTSAPAGTRARSATSPTTTCSWCCCGARSRRAGSRSSPTRCAAMPRVPRGAGVGDLRALPRRHRLGDHRGGRGGGRRGRVPAPPVPGRLLRRRLPGLVRPRGALPVEPADRRRAHERDGGLAVRARAGARERRRGRGRPRGAPDAAALRDRLRPRRAAADLHGRRARAAQRPGVGRRPGPRATTTAGCTGRRWTGRRPSAVTTRRPSRAVCGRGCGG